MHFDLLKINMKIKFVLIIFIAIGLNACQNTNQKQTEVSLGKDTIVEVKSDKVEIIQPKEVEYALALSPNAIQMVNQNTGSTKEISFGMPFNQIIETIEKVLQSKSSVGTNNECGAGPLKMATWDNGLTLLFKEKKNEWYFVGWAAKIPKNPKLKLNTMAGIGIGSTREEMESATVIKVSKTSLGYEFSTKADDLFGIFDGSNNDAKITNLWSGISCNFR